MMKVRHAIVFLLCVVFALPLMACSKSTVGGGGGDGKTYTVTFKVGEAAEAAGATVYPTSKNVKSGGTCGELPVPTGYTGYNFSGWYTDGGVQFTATTKVLGDITVTARWMSDEEQNEQATKYEESLTPENGWLDGHLYIHYKRNDHLNSENGVVTNNAESNKPNYNTPINSQIYKNWGLWAWPVGNANGRLFNAMLIDESGAVFDIDLTKTYNDCGWDDKANGGLGAIRDIEIDYSQYNSESKSFGALIHMISSRSSGSHWLSDIGDRTIPLAKAMRSSGGAHWFINQGEIGSANYAAKPLDNPYKDIEPGSAITRASGDGMINSAATSTYPVWNERVQNFDSSTGYQIFIASFADSTDYEHYPNVAGDGIGDLRGIIEKLDYLESMNVDVLWLTPFQDSTNYHGYDIKDYYSVDSRFGTLADYRELVYRAHQKGMKVVMDFVLNHTSKSNPWFIKSQNLVKETAADGTEIDYRQFYNWINQDKRDSLSKEVQSQWYGDPYGYYFYSSFSSDMPELNYDYQPVRDAILDVCDYWMSFGLDGFRLDAVKHIYMQNEIEPLGKSLTGIPDSAGSQGVVDDGLYSHDQNRNINFYREFNYRLKTAHPNAFVVGENLDGWNARTKNYYQGIDSQFDFNTYYAGRGFASVRGVTQLQKQGDSVVETSKKADETWMSSAFTTYLEGYQMYKQINPNFISGQFTSNHDLPRARSRMALKGTDGAETDWYTKIEGSLIQDSESALFMYYGMLMTLPGVTWIYYGDEIGMEGVMDFTLTTQSTDSLLSEPHEDKIYRQPMKWKASGNASFAIGSGDLVAELSGINATSSVKSVEEQQADSGTSLLKWVQTLTGIRKEYQLGTATNITNNGTSGNKISYKVQGGNGAISVTIIAGNGATTTKPSNAKAFWSGSVAGKTCSVVVTAA